MSAYLLLSLTAFFWSLNWIIGRAIAGHVTPFALAYVRWIVAIAVMLPFAWPVMRAHREVIRREWKSIAVLGFLGMGVHNVFAYAGLQYTQATNGVILNSSVPIMIILLGWLIYRDAISRMQCVGVAVSMLGVLAILTRGDPAVLASLELNKGDLIIVTGMMFWSAYTIFLRHSPVGLPGLAFLASCAIVGLIALTPLVIAEFAFMGGHIEFTPATIGAILYVGIFPSILAYVFWNRAVAEVGPNVAGIFMHLMPVFGSLLAWLFLGEQVQAFHIVGIALILGGITLTTRGRRRVEVDPGPE